MNHKTARQCKSSFDACVFEGEINFTQDSKCMTAKQAILDSLVKRANKCKHVYNVCYLDKRGYNTILNCKCTLFCNKLDNRLKEIDYCFCENPELSDYDATDSFLEDYNKSY